MSFLVFIVLVSIVKTQGGEPVQVKTIQNGQELTCHCKVSQGSITQVGVVFEACKTEDLIKGLDLMNLTESKQQIATYDPLRGSYSKVCSSTSVYPAVNKTDIQFVCVWEKRPFRSNINCICVTTLYGVIETNTKSVCIDSSISHIENTELPDDNSDKSKNVPIEPAETKSEGALIAPTSKIVDEILPTDSEKIELEVEIYIGDSKNPVINTPTEEKVVEIGLMRTEGTDTEIHTVISSPILISEIPIANEKDGEITNMDQLHNIKETNGTIKNLFNIKSIEDKVKLIVSQVVSAVNSSLGEMTIQNIILDKIIKELRNEVAEEMSRNAVNLTNSICPLNSTNAVSVLKDLKKEYEFENIFDW